MKPLEILLSRWKCSSYLAQGVELSGAEYADFGIGLAIVGDLYHCTSLSCASPLHPEKRKVSVVKFCPLNLDN